MRVLTRRAALLSGAATLLAACASRRSTSAADIPAGTGTFQIPGGARHRDTPITVHYHRPAGFKRNSPILIVLAGAGRNGDDYRDAWIPFADAAGVFVAAPSYPEEQYDAGAYQMGGVIENLVIGKPRAGSSASVIYLNDEDLRFDVNPRRAEWLFPDFDRLFARIKEATGSKQQGYDMFGHSAGGQILHRHALLCPESRARRIVAANSGFYTLPDVTRPQPVGMAGLAVDEAWLRRSFACDLTVMLGEADNDSERGGIHLHTPLIDQQGTNRLDRGRYFYRFAEERARAMRADFRWTLRTVPGVGHDYRGMTRAAAELLYP